MSTVSVMTGRYAPPATHMPMMAVICGMPMRAHDGVVAEDAAEVVGVGEDVFLQGKKDAGGVDEVERGDAVLDGDGLRAENLLGGHGEEGAGFHGGVVGDDHAQAAG